MLTPPEHLILPLLCSGVCVCHSLNFVWDQSLFVVFTCSLFKIVIFMRINCSIWTLIAYFSRLLHVVTLPPHPTPTPTPFLDKNYKLVTIRWDPFKSLHDNSGWSWLFVAGHEKVTPRQWGGGGVIMLHITKELKLDTWNDRLLFLMKKNQRFVFFSVASKHKTVTTLLSFCLSNGAHCIVQGTIRLGWIWDDIQKVIISGQSSWSQVNKMCFASQ